MTFGDFTPDDAFDLEPPDPEQVARKLHAVRHGRGLEGHRWEQLSEAQRVVLVAVVAHLLAWLRRQGGAR